VTQSLSTEHRLSPRGESAAWPAVTAAARKIEAVMQRQVRVVARHVVECARQVGTLRVAAPFARK